MKRRSSLGRIRERANRTTFLAPSYCKQPALAVCANAKAIPKVKVPSGRRCEQRSESALDERKVSEFSCERLPKILHFEIPLSVSTDDWQSRRACRGESLGLGEGFSGIKGVRR